MPEVEQHKRQPTGMAGFTVIWFGQLISLLGSGMTTFAISLWLYDQTQAATPMTLAMLSGFGAQIVFTPLAGAIVDRWDRKKVMILTDLVAGLTTIALLILLSLDVLAIWHVYILNFVAGAFGAFQFPAYSSAVTLMLPKEHYGRASGMIGLAGSASGILAPILAGALYLTLGMSGIMVIDIITFVVAVVMLLIVFIPSPEQSAEGAAAGTGLWTESVFGFKYIFARPSLLGVQMVFFFINLIAMFGFSLTAPMILARTSFDALALSSSQSAGAVGGVIGGLLMSAWGGPKRRIYGVLGGMVLINLFGTLPMGLGQSVIWWSLAGFLTGAILPVLNGSNQAIWQAKVQPDIQGRVFAARRFIAQSSAIIAMLSAGPLADRVFEPAMTGDGALVDVFGWLVGTGPGAGMAVMFVVAAVLGTLVALAGFLFPAVRNVEDIMPDHDAAAAQSSTKVPVPA